MLMYMGLLGAVHAIETVVEKLVLAPIAESTSDSVMGLYLILIRIVIAAIAAFADTVFLSRIGREIDKPYWRIPDDREALRRFYRLWLLLGLSTLVFVQIIERITGGDPTHPAGFFLFISLILWVVLLHAFGSAVMFHGKVAREEVNEAFGVMSRQAGLIMGLCFFGIFAAFTLSLADAMIAAGALPLPAEVAASGLLASVDGYVSCLIFTYVWLVCKYDRDEYERDGEDFDL
jgi:hypothetical protein